MWTNSIDLSHPHSRRIRQKIRFVRIAWNSKDEQNGICQRVVLPNDLVQSHIIPRASWSSFSMRQQLIGDEVLSNGIFARPSVRPSLTLSLPQEPSQTQALRGSPKPFGVTALLQPTEEPCLKWSVNSVFHSIKHVFKKSKLFSLIHSANKAFGYKANRALRNIFLNPLVCFYSAILHFHFDWRFFLLS